MKIIVVGGGPAGVKAALRCKPKRFRGRQTPLMLFVGSDSPPPQHAIAAAIHAAWPGSRVVLLPGQERFATSTASEMFANEAINFFTETADLSPNG
jgi:hypothetical protein